MLRSFTEPLTFESAEVPDPGPGALVVKMTHGGVCGTDIHLSHGNLPIPIPVILGHEGIGEVWKLGEGVDRDFAGAPMRIGDSVAWMSWYSVRSLSLVRDRKRADALREPQNLRDQRIV